MDKIFLPTINWACDYLSMLGFMLIYASKTGHSYTRDAVSVYIGNLI